MTGRGKGIGVIGWLLLLSLAAAFSAPAEETDPVGAALFSDPVDFQIVDDYLYILYSYGFAAVDLSSSYDPVRLFQKAIPGEGRGIYAADSLVYLSCGTGGLVTVNVSRPAAPVVVDTVPARSSFGRIAENRGRLLVADDREGMVIFSLADPLRPELLSVYETGVEIADIAAGGRVAYLATELAGVLMADVSSWEGVPLPSLPGLAPAVGLVLSGDTLFVACADSTIRAADVSDSSAPSILPDQWTAPDSIGAVAGFDSLLTVAAGDSILLLRKGNLAAGPAGSFPDSSGARRIAESDGLIGIASPTDGLVLTGLVLPQTAALLSRFPVGKDLRVGSAAVDGDTAYLSLGADGILLLSVRDPEEPDSLGRFATVGSVTDCDAAGGLLYTIEGSGSTAALRIYDGAAGAVIGSTSLRGSLLELALRDSLLYVCNGTGGLLVLDVSDSSAPFLVDSLTVGGIVGRTTRSIAFREGSSLAATAEGTGGIRVVDLSDPIHPVELGSHAAADFVTGVAWGEGGLLYAALRSTGVLVIDASDPSAPDSAGFLDMDLIIDRPLWVDKMVRAGEALYLGELGLFGETGRLHVISLSVPEAPRWVLDIPSSGSPNRLRLGESITYVAAGPGGFEQYGIFEDFGLVRRSVYRPYPSIVLAAASDSRILAVDAEGGVWPVSVVSGDSLAVGMRYDLGGPASDVVVDGQRAFVASAAENRVALLELPLTTQAFFSKWIQVDAPPEGLDVADSLLYVAQGGEGLAVFDISRTDTILRVGSFVNDGAYDLGGAGAATVTVEGDVAYVVTRDRNNSLFLLDVSDPADIKALSSYGSGRRAFHVAVYGDYAYLSERISGMAILSVQNPEAPFFVIDRNDMINARPMEVAEDVLFVARRANGLSVLDLTNAFNPAVLLDVTTVGSVDDLALHSSYLVLADRSSVRVFLQEFANTDQQAPSYTVGILPNPFVNAFVEFVVVASEALIDEPRIRFTMDETDSLLSVFPLNAAEHIYHAGYRLSRTGIGNVRVEGEDLAGNKSETNRGFSVSYVRGAKGGSIYDESGKVEVVIPAAASDREDYVLLLPASAYELGDRMRGMPRPAAGPFRVSLGSLDGPVSVRLHGVFPEEGEETPALWRLEGNNWVLAGGAYDLEGNRVEADLPGSSTFLFSLRGGAPAPFVVRLDPNRPNPFNPTTTLRFHLSRSAPARLAVYDVAGRLVRVLADGKSPAGWNEAVWNGENERGRPVGSGIYLSRLEAQGQIRTGKMILLR